LKQVQDTPPKKRKKRRFGGDRSGRQLALRRIQREEQRNIWKTVGPHIPSFAEAAQASREVLMEFAEESDDINEEHAPAMDMYMNKKFSASSMVSYEHLGTF